MPLNNECETWKQRRNPTTRSGVIIPDHVREQGASRFKSTAYTVVCEHFGSVCNAGISTAQFLINKRVDVVITGRIGPDENEFPGPAGMQIYLCEKCTVDETLNSFKDRRLQKIEI